jgi:hypothetical protein
MLAQAAECFYLKAEQGKLLLLLLLDMSLL